MISAAIRSERVNEAQTINWRVFVRGMTSLVLILVSSGCGGKSDLTRSSAKGMIDKSEKFTPAECQLKFGRGELETEAQEGLLTKTAFRTFYGECTNFKPSPAGDSYDLPERTTRIQLGKAPPAINCLCGILSESGGDAVAEGLGPILISSHQSARASHPTTVASDQTRQIVSDYWKNKNPADWTDKETQDFLTKSLWVNYFGDIRVPSDVVMNGRRALVPVGDVAIRWESAALVRDALARIESKEYNDTLARLSKDYYVIAIIHIMKAVGQAGFSSHWSREQEDELRYAGAAQAGRRPLLSQPTAEQTRNGEARWVFTSSWLLRPGCEAISPVRVESGENTEGRVDLLMFARDLALENRAGEVGVKTTFWVGMGRSTVTVKFSLKNLAEGSERGL